MLRAILGVCGVALIALGVFGGPMLQSTHEAVTGFFEPETVVEPVVVAQREPVQTDKQLVVATKVQSALPQAQLKKVPQETVIAVSDEPIKLQGVNGLTEVKAAARNDTALIKTAVNSDKSSVAADNSGMLPKAAEVDQIVKTTAGGGPDNTLFVLKERVNLRQGPSIDHPVVLQLDIGQELMEFKRDGKWVHVGAYGTSGKIGWVHGSLVGNN